MNSSSSHSDMAQVFFWACKLRRMKRVVYEPSANRACFVDKYIVSCTNWCRMR